MVQMRPTILVAIIWLLAAQHCSRVTRWRSGGTLQGLKSIGVLIGLNLRIQSAGITTEMLRPDIETRLKRSNIRVVPRAELLQKKTREPILIVNFSDTIRVGDVFAYNME